MSARRSSATTTCASRSVTGERTLFYRKALPHGKVDPLTGHPNRWRDPVYVAVNCDPTTAEHAILHPDLPAIGIGWDEPYQLTDLLTGTVPRASGRRPAGRSRSVPPSPFRIFIDLAARPLTPHDQGGPTTTDQDAAEPWPTSSAAAEHARPAPQLLRDDPALVQGRDHLPAPRQGVHTTQRRRDRGFRGPDARSSTTSPDLGVTAIWLLPFYPSPLRDDGYDIADFTEVHPDYGTLRDFRTLRARGASARPARHHRAGHQPHVSDQHPWFVESRSSPQQPEARLVRVERHRPDVRRRADHLHRHRDARTGPGTRSRSSTTGTGSSATSRT